MNETIRLAIAALFIVVGTFTLFFSWLATPALFLYVLMGSASCVALGVAVVAQGE